MHMYQSGPRREQMPHVSHVTEKSMQGLLIEVRAGLRQRTRMVKQNS